MDLAGLVNLLIYLVVVAVVVGVVAWAIKTMLPQAPDVIVKAVYVIGVLIALLILIQGLGMLRVPR